MRTLLIGVLTVVLVSVATSSFGLYAQVVQNTSHRLSADAKLDRILEELATVKANQQILLRSYNEDSKL